ncbi:MAG: group 1 truncated hemoglobin [bacterium]|nr:group 1 truncated hemoglobin [bacterium]
MVAALVASSTPSAANQESNASLYQRLGGYDAIVAVVNDLLPRLVADPQLGRFWAHRGADGLAREKQLLINFIADRAGGSLDYVGRNMQVTHVGMRISKDDWKVFMVHLKATLDKFELATREKSDVIAFMESTKGDIVE